MSKPEMPTGYECATCGKRHNYPAYVYAHWNEPLTHECECGAKHSVCRGKASPVRKGKAKK